MTLCACCRGDVTNSPADRPTAVELIEAVREYLERDVMTIEGRPGFHARVAHNALGMIVRELEFGPELEAEYRMQIGALLGEDPRGMSLRDLEARLAKEIRAGALDDRLDDVANYVRGSVAAKLKISNPGYLSE